MLIWAINKENLSLLNQPLYEPFSACCEVNLNCDCLTDYDGRVLPSVVNEVLKSVVAKYNASSLLTKRDEVARLTSQNHL